MLRRLIGTSLILALLLLLSPTVSAYYACRVTSIEDMEEAFLKGFSEGHGQIVLSYEATAEQCLRDIKTVEERLATATADYGVVSVRRMVPSPADKENFHFLQFFMTYDMSRRNPARAFPEPNEPSEWAKAEIGRADSLDLTTPGTWYGYKIGITRDHFAKLMLNLYEKATGNKLDRSGVATQFRDTNDPELCLAADLGLIGGVGDNRFDPNGLLTREQMAAILSRTVSKLGLVLPKTRAWVAWADEAAISDWALPSVKCMYETGVLGGVGDNRVDPQGCATKEQAVLLALRIYDYVQAGHR